MNAHSPTTLTLALGLALVVGPARADGPGAAYAGEEVGPTSEPGPHFHG